MNCMSKEPLSTMTKTLKNILFVCSVRRDLECIEIKWFSILCVLCTVRVLSNLTFLSNWRGFHSTFATGFACQQRTLTPSDTKSYPICICTNFENLSGRRSDFEFRISLGILLYHSNDTDVRIMITLIFCVFVFQYIGTLDVPRPSSRVEIVAAMRKIRVRQQEEGIHVHVYVND